VAESPKRVANHLRQCSVHNQTLREGHRADREDEQPTTFELIINLKTAKALGLTIPPSLLARADEAIE